MRGLGVVPVLLAGLLAYGPAAADRAHGTSTHEHKVSKKKSRAGAEKPFGREGDPRKVGRVIRIDMSDTMRFFPSEIRVKRGDTVRIAVRNSGQLPHGLVLGTMEDLKKHADLTKKNGETDHGAAHVAHVQPGATGRIVWHFTKAGEFYYGCLVPGHFEAGMIGTIVVR
jgi:uncharacterized cupredoxin-like copper-binding protein